MFKFLKVSFFVGYFILFCLSSINRNIGYSLCLFVIFTFYFEYLRIIR